MLWLKFSKSSSRPHLHLINWEGGLIYFMNSTLSFQGIHPNTSRWLVNNRKVKLVGIDTASIDYGQSTQYESHRILYAENIPGLENVAHMDKLPAKGFTVYAAPMFITGGSGGPCRIFARLDDNKSIVNAGDRLNSFDVLWATLVLVFIGFLDF